MPIKEIYITEKEDLVFDAMYRLTWNKKVFFINTYIYNICNVDQKGKHNFNQVMVHIS